MNIHTYQSASGRDLIREYIDTLTEPEQIDAISVLECIFKNIIDCFILLQIAVICIYYMLVESRKTRLKRKIKTS